MRHAVAVADRGVGLVTRTGAVVALVAIMALLALGVVVRVIPVFSMAGYDELVELLVAWMTFLGAAALWREGMLYRVDIIAHRLPAVPARVLAVVIRLLMLVFAVVLAVKGAEFAVRSAETTPFLRFPKSFAYASLPVAGAVMAIYSVVGIWSALRRARPADAP